MRVVPVLASVALAVMCAVQSECECVCVCVNVLTYIRIITHLSIRDLDTVRLSYTEFVQIT